jgi:hypothetical protein
MAQPTYSECEAALEAIIWDHVNERAVSEYAQNYPAGHELTVKVLHVDAADVLSLVGEVVDYIGTHWRTSLDTAPADEPAPATPGATTAAAAHE